MTTNHDWFRRTTWSPEDAADFEKRLSRSRSQRAQYLKIQALTLADTNRSDLAEPAIRLATRYLAEDPEGLFTTEVYLTIASANVTKGDIPSALQAHRNAIDSESHLSGIRCRAYLEFAWFVTTHDLTDSFQEALTVMESMQDVDLIFPITQYKYFGSLALISHAFGDREHARQMANNALEAAQKVAGPFSRHKNVGIVKGIDESIQRRIWKLAA